MARSPHFPTARSPHFPGALADFAVADCAASFGRQPWASGRRARIIARACRTSALGGSTSSSDYLEAASHLGFNAAAAAAARFRIAVLCS